MKEQMTYWIEEHPLDEWGNPRKPIKLHKVMIEDSYRILNSLKAFREGKRKGATQLDKEIGRDTCCWGPKSVFLVYNERGHRQQVEYKEYVSKYSNKDIGEYYCLKEGTKEFDVTEHDSLYDFYKAVGFDKEKRKYTNLVF